MLPPNFTPFVAFAAAVALAILAYWLTSQFRVETDRTGRLANYGGTQSASVTERIGQTAVKFSRFDVARWAGDLEWAQLGGYYVGLTPAGLLGQCLLAGGALLAVAFWTQVPVLFIAALVGPAWLYMRVRAAATRVKKRVTRAVPETAALVAAELAAGNPPDRAIERAAELPGEMGTLLARAVAASRSSGRPLFSRKPVRGTLVEQLAGAGLNELLAFAAQLDLIAGKGVAGAELMSDIAKTLAAEYKQHALSAVEKLESDLVIPSVIFFFLPFTAAIIAPLGVALFQVF